MTDIASDVFNGLFGSTNFEVVDFGVPAMRESVGDPEDYVTAEEAMQRLRVGPEQFRKN